MNRLTPESERHIRGMNFSWATEVIEEIDALRAEITRLHEKYDLQLLVVQRDRYREALKIIATQDISQHQMMHVAELALKACNAQAARSQACTIDGCRNRATLQAEVCDECIAVEDDNDINSGE